MSSRGNSVYLFLVLFIYHSIQRIDAQNCSSDIDLVFVLDDSGSICDNDPLFVYGQDKTCNNWKFITTFVANIVNGLNIGSSNTMVGMVRFDTSAVVDWGLKQYTDKASLSTAIQTLAYTGGNTDTYDGLHLMRTQVLGPSNDRPAFPNVAVVVTDGLPTVNVEQLPAEIQAVQNAGILVFVVGVTTKVDEKTLKLISSPPQLLNTSYFIAADYSQVDALRSQLIKTVTQCFSTVTGSTTPTPVQTTTQPLGCLTGYQPDVVFVLDRSGSICDTDPLYLYGRDRTCNNWKFLVQFVYDTVNSLVIGPTATMVGIVSFDSGSGVLWTLDRYQDKASLLYAINNMAYTGGRTDTAGGLRLMRSQVFGQAGDRPNNPNVAVVVTDGKPNVEVDQLPGELSAIQNAGIQTFVVGVTNQVDEDTLKMLSSQPQQLNKNYFVAADYSTVGLVRNQLAVGILAGCSMAPGNNPTPAAITDCSNGQRQPDIVFVLDGSGSICDSDPLYVFGRDSTCNNWKFLVQFVYNIVHDLTIGETSSMVGVVTFDTTAKVNWPLNRYFDNSSLLLAINNSIPYTGGNTNTTGGLRLMRTRVFGLSGDRPNNPNIAVVITDGKPTYDVDKLPAEISAVQNAGIKTFVVGVTNQVDENTLKTISSSPQQRNVNYFVVSDYSQIDLVRSQLKQSALPCAK